MYLLQPLKLLAIGAGLVTSTSIWVFDSKVVIPKIQTRTSNPNINSWPKVPKLANRTGKVLVDSNLEKKDSQPNLGINFMIKDQNKTIMLRYPQNDLESLEIRLYTTKTDYLDFDKYSMNIHLFKNAVWYGNTNDDEYKDPLQREEIDQLFQGQDEVKVKQLLLSLQQSRKWMRLPGNEDSPHFYADIHYQNSNEELGNLKIRYFKDFKDLKEYVHEKVKLCTQDDQSCVADIGELDIMNTDQKSFFGQ